MCERAVSHWQDLDYELARSRVAATPTLLHFGPLARLWPLHLEQPFEPHGPIVDPALEVALVLLGIVARLDAFEHGEQVVERVHVELCVCLCGDHPERPTGGDYEARIRRVVWMLVRLDGCSTTRES